VPGLSAANNQNPMRMTVGKIASLWRFPVKSMQGEKLGEMEFDGRGALGDRAYALIDRETGKVVSAKSVKLFPEMLLCSAAYVKVPEQGKEPPPVKITLSNGKTIDSNSDKCDTMLSEFFGRDVTLARNAPDDFTIDVFYPDVENMDPAGKRNMFSEQKLGSALFKSMGVDTPLPPGSFMDVFPVSLMTTSTLDQLHAFRPETDFNERRFRMNVIVRTPAPGFVENAWVGKSVTLGNNVPLMITMPDPRCVMTTLSQEGIPRDNHVLRTLVQHNRLDIMGSGQYPCAGVYAVVGNAGMARVNDIVTIT
jgi:uncharacterized protein YcbX